MVRALQQLPELVVDCAEHQTHLSEVLGALARIRRHRRAQ
jgi:hypothetical protein